MNSLNTHGLWQTRRTYMGLALVCLCSLSLGVASGQFSATLTNTFKSKTLNIGQGIQGALKLTVQTDGDVALAIGGVRTKEGDKVSFDSNGFTNTGGYWQRLGNSGYTIRLKSPQKTSLVSETSSSDNEQMWVVYSQQYEAAMVTGGPGRPPIMPLALQIIEHPKGQMGATAILEVKGDVDWYEDGTIHGKENLLRISNDGSHFSTITDCVTKDGALYFSSADGSKYKVYDLSIDFTATVEQLPN